MSKKRCFPVVLVTLVTLISVLVMTPSPISAMKVQSDLSMSTVSKALSTSSLTISNAVVQIQQTSLQLPPGFQGQTQTSATPTIAGTSSGYFTIAVLPDTQYYSENYPYIFENQTQWIVDNAQAQHIVFVSQVGDLVQDYNIDNEWVNAQNAMGRIRNAGIPYSVVPGNHDLNFAAGDTTYYDKYFPYTDFTSYSWYGSGQYPPKNGDLSPNYPSGSNANNYETFSAMGQDFVILNLACTPDVLVNQGMYDWANGVLNHYSKYKAIVVTHGYIDTNGNYIDSSDVAGKEIHDKIVNNNSNVVGVICGHFGDSGGKCHASDIGEYGNTVENLLFDPQEDPNGGDGWLRLYKFYPQLNKVSAVTYSPYLDQYDNSSTGSSAGKFDFNLSMTQVSTPPLTLSNAIVQEHETSLQLPPDFPIYLFGYGTGGGMPSGPFSTGQYASVTDANGNMVASLAITTQNSNSFTTGSRYPVIGGVAVSGFSSYSTSYGSNPSPAATSASDTFSVIAPGSLVVVIAIGGDEQTLTLAGDLQNLQIDASYPGSPDNALVIAHAYPSPGQYTVTENTLQTAYGQDPNNAGDLIGVFLFVPGATPTPTPTPTLTSIEVTPTSPANLALGSTQQFTATGTYSDGSYQDLTSQVSWSSSNTGVATISSAGLATGVALGTTNIIAGTSGVTSSAITLTITTHVCLTSADQYNDIWAGYSIMEPGVTDVTGSWVVPSVIGGCAESTKSCTWVGIDGLGGPTVEQIGTDQWWVNGQPFYQAWWEAFPYNAQQPLPAGHVVNAGDFMRAEVKYTGTDPVSGNSTFDLILRDTPRSGNPWNFDQSVSIAAPARSTAEWIVERPEIGWDIFGNVIAWPLPLADFGTLHFSNAKAKINGATGTICGFPSFPNPPLIMTSDGEKDGTVLAQPSSLNDDGSAFDVTWNGTPPVPCSSPFTSATISTQVGSSVIVTLPNTVVGFNTITGVGNTTTITSQANPAGPTPSDFRLVSPFIDIGTTAMYTGNVTVAIAYDPSGITDPQNLRLFHWNGSGWDDVTTSVDTVSDVIYGQVLTLSPFFIGDPAPPASTPGLASGGHGVPLFPTIYIGIGAVIGATSLLMLRRRKSKKGTAAAGSPSETAGTSAPLPQASGAVFSDPVRRLQRLKGMLDAGLITQQDYDEEKKKILEEYTK